MEVKPKRLHVMFFPLMAAGHMIPILDIAKLFASHNVKSTIITTPMNAPTFTKPLESYINVGPQIDVKIIPFPSKEAGLPEGVENFEHLVSDEMSVKFMKAMEFFKESLEQVLEKLKPDCLVADMYFHFATDVAAKFNIPRLVFEGTSYFSLCVAHAMFKYNPQKLVTSNEEEFDVPHLPHEMRFQRSQLPESYRDEGNKQWEKVVCLAKKAEEKSFGVIMNSFYELERDYVHYYRNIMGKRAWDIGPVSLCNRENEAKFQRGKVSSIDEQECLKWLDSKKTNSVIYVCFGSLVKVSKPQVEEIAMGLEACEHDFIWVIKRNDEEWLPQGFEKRVQGKGLIITGWAPQVLILDHDAVGAFVTHCGWNSILEAISYGVPMVTWPAFAEQFYNEKLVIEMLKLGVSIGTKQWSRVLEFDVKGDVIKAAIRRIMVGEEALEIRNRANKIKECARNAIEVGGSSYCNMDSLLHQLSSYVGNN